MEWTILYESAIRVGKRNLMNWKVKTLGLRCLGPQPIKISIYSPKQSYFILEWPLEYWISDKGLANILKPTGNWANWENGAIDKDEIELEPEMIIDPVRKGVPRPGEIYLEPALNSRCSILLLQFTTMDCSHRILTDSQTLSLITV